MELEQTLRELGLKDKKATVYLTVLKIGSGTVTEIAASSGIKRPTCYDILEDLINRGLINQIYKGSKRFFSAEDPQVFLTNHRKQEEKISEALPHLEAYYNRLSGKPKVRLYEGVEGIQKAEMEILDSTQCEYYYFGSLKSIDSIVGAEFLEDHVKERVKRGIWSNALRIKALEVDLPFMASDDKYFRRVRYLPYPVFGEIVTMTISDRKVFITSSKEECYSMVIESSELVNLMKTVWHSCWMGAK